MSAKEYLWKKSGTPDAQTQELEALLSEAKLTDFRIAPQKKRTPFVPLAVVLAVAAGLSFLFMPRGPFFEVQYENGKESKLHVNEWLETSSNSVVIQVADIGSLNVLSDSKLRLKRTDANEHRIELVRGTLHAKVSAPPRLFVVETPAATAVDLGCEYDLKIDENGNTQLVVITGFVSLEGTQVKSVVPAGFVSISYKGKSPGLPVRTGASSEFQIAATAFDNGDMSAEATLLNNATVADAETLWHLLSRVRADSRAKVSARLQQLVPTEFNESDVMALDAMALDGLWQQIVSN
jgi:FecR protein